MLSRKTSFKSLTKTPKGGMRLVTRAQRPRVIRKIDTNLSSTGPKEAVFQATRDAGGVMQVDSLSDLPRGPRQVYYRNQVKKGASTSLSSGQGKDGELLEVLLKMKSEEEPLIRKVTLEKENLLSFLHLKTS